MRHCSPWPGCWPTCWKTGEASNLTHDRELAEQLADRYTAAVAQFGSDTLDIRLGGLYALEQIAVDSETHHRAVVEVLSAFVREHTIPGRPGAARRSRHVGALPTPADRASGAVPPAPKGPDTDIQAALTVLGRLPARTNVPRRADLSGSHLSGAQLRYADLSGADLAGANLAGALLVEANLTNAQMFEANLTDAGLGRADLTGVQLNGANLTGAHMAKANLTEAGLGRANLTGATLSEADLTDADLCAFMVDLTGTRLLGFGANLTGATMIRANLTGAAMFRVNLTGARLDGVNLTGAQLDGVNLAGATGLTQEQLDGAVGDGRTVLPGQLARPTSWSEPDAG